MAQRSTLTFEARGNYAQRHNKRRGNKRSGEILDVALGLFANQGYTGVSIKDIARAGKINSALIYYYFTNKDHLFVEVLKYSVRMALSRQQRFDGVRADPIAEINFWFDANAKLAKPLGQMLRLMLDYRTSRKRSPSVERLIAGFYEAELGLLRSAINFGIRRGLFRSLDTEKTSLFISTHLDGLMVAAAIRSGYDLAAGLRQMRKILFEYLGHLEVASARPKAGARSSKLRVVA